MAAYISAGGPGDKAGIRAGDELVAIDTFPVKKALEVPQALWQIPLLGQTKYTLRRQGIEFQKGNIFIQAAPRDSAVYYQYAVGVRLSGDRLVRLLPANERGKIAAFLYLVPGVVYSLLLSLFRKAEYVRRGHVLGKHGGNFDSACHFSSLLPDFP